jgi:hypothetical protein
MGREGSGRGDVAAAHLILSSHGPDARMGPKAHVHFLLRGEGPCAVSLQLHGADGGGGRREGGDAGEGQRRREKNYGSAHGGDSRPPPLPKPRELEALPSKLRRLIAIQNKHNANANAGAIPVTAISQLD